MMLKLVLCLLFLNGVLSYEVHEGIHIRDTSSTKDLMKVDVSKKKYLSVPIMGEITARCLGDFKKECLIGLVGKISSPPPHYHTYRK